MKIRSNAILNSSKELVYQGLDLLSLGRGWSRSINRDSFRFPAEGARFYPNLYQQTKHEFIKEHAQGVVVDLGAHIGLYTVLMSRTANHVIAFEPANHTRTILHKTVRMNSAYNVEIRSELVGRENGSVDFIEVSSNLSNANALIGVQGKRIIKEQISLDSLNRQINFLKMNIEGAELLALQGGLNSFKNLTAISMEVHPEQIGLLGGSVEELWDLLKNMGASISRDGEKVSREAFLKLESCTSVQIRL